MVFTRSLYLHVYLALALALTSCACLVNGQVKIVQTNDDGWAVANIRAQNDALVAAGFDVSDVLLCIIIQVYM